MQGRTATSRPRLGELLVKAGVLSREQLAAALEKQKQTGLRLGELLVREGLLTEEQLARILQDQLGIKAVDLARAYIDPRAVRLVPEALARRHGLVPLRVEDGHLVVAMRDPLDYFALEDVRLVARMPVRPVIATGSAVQEALGRAYGGEAVRRAVPGAPAAPREAAAEVAAAADVEAAPVVRFVQTLLENAVRAGASDVHLEPDEDTVRVRLRVDGFLRETLTIPPETYPAVLARLKIMANLNIAEHRVPQDGRTAVQVDGREVDVRVSVMPVVQGEKVALRLLDRAGLLLDKHRLGLSPVNLARFDDLLRRPHGIILVTGPTGSGKTTTLYAMLQELNDESKNIVTLEDPVEYRLKGINQTQVHPRAGLTFAAGLRAILRQDPDIIMVGEIRDLETAEIAVRAALTGHLVLSTLHTNDAPAVVTRLADMGIPHFLIAASLAGCIAQRLVRKVCAECAEGYEATPQEKEILGVAPETPMALRRGRGCPWCLNSGYRGRTGIFEILTVTEAVRQAIDRKATPDDLRELARREGMVDLFADGREKVLAGETTLAEVLRVTQGQ
jgi:type IV pilus assembly protein PilB